jgi:hypothetical protein
VRQAAATKQETCRPIGRFVMFHTFRDLRRDLRLLSAFATGTERLRTGGIPSHAPMLKTRRESSHFATPAWDNPHPQMRCSSPPYAPFSAA